MSSRNAYLSPEERRAAGVLFKALTAAEKAIAAGERRGDEVRRILHEVLVSEPLVARIEYAEAVDGETFQPLEQLRGQVVLPMALRIGGTRLIDNFQLAIPG
jgi:pantoate--beta-alanine ligase